MDRIIRMPAGGGGEGYRIPPDSSRGVFPLGLEGLNPQRNISYCEYMLNINVS